MAEVNLERWFERIDELVKRVIAREAGPAEVERLAASIIDYVRAEAGDTLWLDHAIEGIAVGISWNRRASAIGGETLVGLRLALSSAAHALAPLDQVTPSLRGYADIDKRLDELRWLGINLRV